MSYRWLDELTRADVAFEAVGDTPDAVLHSAWSALVELMLPHRRKPAEGNERRRILRAAGWEDVLLELLEWVVFVKDAEGLILAPGEVLATPAATGVAVDVRAACLSPDGGQGTDVKAVTLHRFAMEETHEGWRATVVLDV